MKGKIPLALMLWLFFSCVKGHEIVPMPPEGAITMGGGRAGPWVPPFPKPRPGWPVLAIVIDDLGSSVEQAAAFAEIPIPLTFAVLPDGQASREVLRFLEALDREVIAHLPMEPKDPDMMASPNFLTTSLGPEEVRAKVRDFLDLVPGAIGANNHMGSRFTTDLERMVHVMEVLKERGLFFLDSRTTKETRACEAARLVGVRCVERDVFLDDDPSPQAVLLQLQRALEVAKGRGFAIAIGHPFPATIEALWALARAKEREVDLAPLSSIVEGTQAVP